MTSLELLISDVNAGVVGQHYFVSNKMRRYAELLDTENEEKWNNIGHANNRKPMAKHQGCLEVIFKGWREDTEFKKFEVSELSEKLIEYNTCTVAAACR